MDFEHSQRANEQLGGVGGWLMILVLWLTFIAPFWQGRIAVRAFKTLLIREHLTSVYLLFFSVVVAVYAGLAIFSFIAGLMLWSENPRAPTITKAYFIVSVLVVGVLWSTYRMAGFEFNLPKILFNRSGIACIWYAYLLCSKRVRLTYGSNPIIIRAP